jgi:hypothetical protein
MPGHDCNSASPTTWADNISLHLFEASNRTARNDGSNAPDVEVEDACNVPLPPSPAGSQTVATQPSGQAHNPDVGASNGAGARVSVEQYFSNHPGRFRKQFGRYATSIATSSIAEPADYRSDAHRTGEDSGSVVDASAYPLPSSTTSSRADYVGLDADQDDGNHGSIVYASEIPLPPSLSSTPSRRGSVAGADGALIDSDSSASGSAAAREPSRRSYWAEISYLRKAMPQLEVIQAGIGRHLHVGSLMCMDYRGTSNAPRRRRAETILNLPGDTTNREEIIRIIKDLSTPPRRSRLLTRYIMVKDLSSDLIEGLGTAFGIDPEFFAEHLNRSGFSGCDYNAPLPEQWDTYGMPKSYASVKWFRAVRQKASVTDWLYKPSEWLASVDPDLSSNLTKFSALKNNGRSHVPAAKTWTSVKRGSLRAMLTETEHAAVVRSNIFRETWTLSGRQKVTEGTSSSSDEEYVPTAWEERVSCFFYDKGQIPIGT